jgi:hypothetical protein
MSRLLHFQIVKEQSHRQNRRLAIARNKHPEQIMVMLVYVNR